MLLDTIHTIIPIIRDTVFVSPKNETLEFLSKTGTIITAILTIIISGIISYITILANAKNTKEQIEANAKNINEQVNSNNKNIQEQIKNANDNLILQINTERENFLKEKILENKQKTLNEFVKLRDEAVEIMTKVYTSNASLLPLINLLVTKNSTQAQLLVRLKVDKNEREEFNKTLRMFAQGYLEYVLPKTTPERKNEVREILASYCSSYTSKTLILIENLTDKFYSE